LFRWGRDTHMDWWQAVILGIVEGLTEYLPVSSTGHLILAQRAMGIPNSEAANAYAIAIQGGAILAVLYLYAKRMKQMALGLAGRDEVGRKLLAALLAAMAPLAFIVPADKLIEEYLFGLVPVTASWFVGGVAILAVAWWRQRNGQAGERPGMDLAQITWKMGLVIGACQLIAVWPGTSRSLVTIVAGVLVGLRLGAAVEFSFILGVATLGGATILKAAKDGDVMLAAYHWSMMLLGFAMAFVSAVAAVKWMVAYLNKHGLQLFGYYRIALAIVVAILLALEVLQP
jgi:undecaprenyl-diphosphatase